jgi:hypothetical protein
VERSGTFDLLDYGDLQNTWQAHINNKNFGIWVRREPQIIKEIVAFASVVTRKIEIFSV